MEHSLENLLRKRYILLVMQLNVMQACQFLFKNGSTLTAYISLVDRSGRLAYLWKAVDKALAIRFVHIESRVFSHRYTQTVPHPAAGAGIHSWHVCGAPRYHTRRAAYSGPLAALPIRAWQYWGGHRFD